MGETRRTETLRVPSRRIALLFGLLSVTTAFSPRPAFSDPITSAAWEATQAAAYPNGIVYFLIGDAGEMAQKEYERFFTVSRWLTNKGYQPIVIANARLIDIRAAVTNPRTTGIIYSSHGSSDGRIWDFDQVSLPDDIFVKDAGERFRFFVVSACHGEACVNRYQFQAGTNKTWWEGITNTDDLYAFLNGEEFDERLFKNTVGGVKQRQCAFQFYSPDPPR